MLQRSALMVKRGGRILTIGRSATRADGAGTDVLDTVCPDVDPVGSSPIRKHVAFPGDGVSDFQPSVSTPSHVPKSQ
jgi:hypothetical protein